MFRVIEGSPRTYWVATDGSSTYAVGQLVSFSAASKAANYGTVKPLAVPAGAADTTNFQVIAGVVVGINDRTTAYSSTYKTDSRAGVVTQALQLAREWIGQEGMYSKADPQLLVQIAEITPHTVIEGDIRYAALATASTLLTVSATTDSDGLVSANTTTNSCIFTPVANVCTIYCRTGANMGLYRVTGDTSTTLPQCTVAFPYDVVAGDTFVRVPFKQGLSSIYIGDTTTIGMYVDNGGQTIITANTFDVLVYKLDLALSGSEKIQFRFANTHFDFRRA